MNIELHPLCTLFPRVSGGEFDALVQDIAANGLQNPIVLHDGMILDGGNRYLACLEAGVEPSFREYAGGSIVQFVLSANLHRRHLSPGQQAAIVASAQDWANAQVQGANRHTIKTGNVAGLETVAQRAAESGASERTQRMADKVAKTDPELAKKVAHGEISLPKAIEQITPPKPETGSNDEMQDAFIALSEENERLKDRISVDCMDASEDEKTQAQATIQELRERVRVLEIELSAVKQSRDTYQRENGEMKRQIAMMMRKAKVSSA